MATYYVDATTGDDGDDGLTEAAAWQTIAKVNGETFAAGDSILFKKGETWRETLTVPSSGSAGSPITFGAYGTGADPIFNGASTAITFAPDSGFSTTYSAALNFDDDWGNKLNWRQILTAASISASGTSIRVTFTASTAQNLVLTDAAIGARNAATDDFADTPTRITFAGGATGCTVLAGQSTVSDAIAFTLDEAVDHLISVFLGTNGYTREVWAGGSGYIKTSAGEVNESQTVTVSGYSATAMICVVSKVEVDVSLPNVWTAAVTIATYQINIDDSSRGHKVANVGALAVEDDWFWASNVLYIYGDPAGKTIVATERQYGIDIEGKSYLAFSDLRAQYYQNDGFGINITDEATAASNIAFARCSSRWNRGYGFSVYGNVSAVTHTDCLAEYNWVDGFIATGTAATHDLTNIGCEARYNGDIYFTFTGAGDGFTSHAAQYDVRYHYCLSHHNYYTGFANVDNGSGELYNCVAYANGGDYSGQGGQNKVDRAGIYQTASAANATSGTTWIVKNCVGMDNYPCQLTLSAWVLANGTRDYNAYLKTGSASSVSDFYNDGSAKSWDTYHITNGYETNSQYADPLFVSTVTPDFHLQAGSPCRDAGVDVGLTQDYDGHGAPQGSAPDIGAYEYLRIGRRSIFRLYR